MPQSPPLRRAWRDLRTSERSDSDTPRWPTRQGRLAYPARPVTRRIWAMEPNDTAMSGKPSLRTLVVEDSQIIRGNLTETLEENTPIEVVGAAEDENSAIDWLHDSNNRCDLVIIDIFLKSGSGIGVLKRLQRDPHPPRRVVLSNHATPEVRAKCTDLGAEKVFDKSNEIDEMLAWFNRVAAGGRGLAEAR